MTTALPFQAQQPIFDRVGGVSELGHMNQEERNRYFYSLNKYRTNLSVMKNERAEGREEKAVEIARSMKKDGMTTDMIVRYTGLTQEEVEAL